MHGSDEKCITLLDYLKRDVGRPRARSKVVD